MKAIWFAAAALIGAAPAMAQHQGHGQPPMIRTTPPPPHGHRPPPPPPGVHGGPEADHAHATAGDQREVLAVVDRMFAALAAKDGAALLAEVVPEGRATANDLATRRVRGSGWAEFAGHLARIPGRPMERLIDPHVHVEGDIAMIWSRYEFELDGRFSHCGIDHFDLVRQDGRWRVLNITWTQQYEGCPGRGTSARPEPPHGDPRPPQPPRTPPGERG